MSPCLISLIVLSAVFFVTGTKNATIIVIPSAVVALINDTTFFNCSTTSAEVEWLFGSNQYPEPVIYSYGTVKPTYVDRFRVQNYTNSFGNHFTLIFEYVTKNDAGPYICRDPDDSNQEGMVHLTALETHPVCESDLSVDGLIGPNSCSIKPDTVQLSCSVRYNGDQVPELQWTKMGESMTINSSICFDSGNLYTCSLTMETELQMERDSYICQTTQSRTNQYKCTSDVFRIIYVFGEHTEQTRTVNDKVNCSVNSSSQSCTLTWIFDDGTTNWTESHESVMFKRPGRFICQAICILRNDSCTFTAMTVNVSVIAGPQDNDHTTIKKIVLWITFFLIIFIFLRKKTKTKRQNIRAHDSAGEELSMLRNYEHAEGKENELKTLVQKPGNDILRIIRPRKDVHREKRVKGLTILTTELFVAFDSSAVIEIFHIDNIKSFRSAKVKGLGRPGSMAACEKNNCLYILDKRNNGKKQIIRFNTNGTVICAWKTHNKDKGRISVNHDGNVVMTVYDDHMLKIYSPKGILLSERTIRFKSIPMPFPIDYIFHAINLDDGKFILCHGMFDSELSKVHRVCKVNSRGELLRSFGSEKGSDDEHHLSSPAYLAKRNDGSILVADQDNDRIILLNSELTLKHVLFNKEKNKVSLPEAMYVYENNQPARLFLGCNDTKDSGGYVLVLRLG